MNIHTRTLMLYAGFMFFLIAGITFLLSGVEKNQTFVRVGTGSIAQSAQSVSVDPNENRARTTLASLSFKEKVGQLFILGVPSAKLSPKEAEQISTLQPGGILLLEKNIQNESQLKNLIASINALEKIPPFIAIDEEGGVVSRLKEQMPDNKPQKDIPEEMQAYLIARERAEYLKGLGISMNFAPVLDSSASSSSFLKDRAFSGSTTDIGQLGKAMVRGFIEGGIVPVPKHFPPHPTTYSDPHTTPLTSNDSREELQQKIAPFKTVFAEQSAPLMISHVSYSLFGNIPATLSTDAISFAQHQLPNASLLISDDMEMGALASFNPTQATLSSLRAGMDMLILSGSHRTLDERSILLQEVTEQIQEGKLSTEELDKKILKILRAKNTEDL